ncbi:MAG TPA: PIN domain-containing protein [Blastocatellia bacterium]|nr:PIN domain-containing protein [Blastocatellia bacterium]
MEEQASNLKEVFLDTSFAIALSSPKDAHHEQAEQISKRLEANGTRLVTTRPVILEIGNALAKQAFRQAAVELIDSLEQDPTAEIVPISEQLYERAFDLYRERRDKEWGLTYCISFVVMSEIGLTAANH